MDLKRKPYKIGKADIDQIKGMGYTITSSMPTDKFIKKHFPNFDLIALLKEVEQSFTITTSLPISRQLIVQEKPPSLSIIYRNDYTGEDDAVYFDREFLKTGKSIVIKHNFCIIPKTYRNKGLVKKVFQTSLQQYVNMDAEKIIVHAGLSGGGYVWARHGFVATDRNEVEVILRDAQRALTPTQFAPVEHLFSAYYTRNPVGKAFPILLWAGLDGMKDVLLEADWHGEVNLKNNEQFSNFKEYVFRS